MRKSLIRIILTCTFLTYTSIGLAGVNPITVTFLSGDTSFPSNCGGTANYIVTVNERVHPPNMPLTLSLTSTGSSAGLTAYQITSGSSTCSGISTLCGSTFSLSAGQSCCLEFSLASATAGSHTMQPIISTKPPVYSAKASSLSVTVTDEPIYKSFINQHKNAGC